jgi:serine/threonine protein kinase
MPQNNDDIQKTHVNKQGSPAADTFLPGQMIGGKYKVLSVLGSGGIGTVYKVEQIFLGQQFALKTLNSSNATDQMIRRFQLEARTASLLNHPNLVKVHDFGILDTQEPYLVMDFVDGITLSAFLKSNGLMSLEQLVACFAQVCLGLAYAHENGIVHRDIKPSNIMISRTIPFGAEGFAKIVDFGIAKLVYSEDGNYQALTTTGEIFGSPLYMSPEQCSGAAVDQRADVYSLGCVLFECMTGTTPFVGQSALNTMLLHQSERVPTLKEASLGKDFPPELELLVEKMLAKAPSDRYQNLGIVANDLAQISKGAPVLGLDQTKRKTAKASKTITLTQRKLALYLVAASLASATVAVPVGYYLGNKQSESSEKNKTANQESTSPKEGETASQTSAKPSDPFGYNPLKDQYLEDKYNKEIGEEDRKRRKDKFEKPFFAACEGMDKTQPGEKDKLRSLMVTFNQLKEQIKDDERLKKTYGAIIEDKITVGHIKLGEFSIAESRISNKLKHATSHEEIGANAAYYQLFAERQGAEGNMKEAFRSYQKGAENFLKAANFPGCDSKSAKVYRGHAGNFLRCCSDVSLHHLHNIPQSIEIGYRSKALLEKNGNDFLMANCLLTLGSALYHDRQYEKAEPILLRCEKLLKVEKDNSAPLLSSCALLELSETQNNLNKKQQALEAAKRARTSIDRFKPKDAGQKQFAAAHRTNIVNQIKKLDVQ